MEEESPLYHREEIPRPRGSALTLPFVFFPPVQAPKPQFPPALPTRYFSIIISFQVALLLVSPLRHVQQPCLQQQARLAQPPLPRGPAAPYPLSAARFGDRSPGTVPGRCSQGWAGAGQRSRCTSARRDESASQKCQLKGKDAASARNLPRLVTGKRCFSARTSPGPGTD